MAKSLQVTVFLATALCLCSLLGSVDGDNRFFVEGKVYCDTCRAQFITKISENMPGAKVRLECSNRSGGELSFAVEGTTGADGMYSLPIDGEHEDEVCEVVLIKSSRPDCDEIIKDPFRRKSARVNLTKNNGIATPVRMANPLGFMKKEPLPECVEVLKELGVMPDDLPN